MLGEVVAINKDIELKRLHLTPFSRLNLESQNIFLERF